MSMDLPVDLNGILIHRYEKTTAVSWSIRSAME